MDKGDQQMAAAVDSLSNLDELVEELESVRLKIKHLDEARWMLERHVQELMEEDGATEARTEKYNVELKRAVSYDPSILTHLREITDPADLEGIYSPEHEEVRQVPERWNMSKGRRLARLGDSHRAIIDDARILGTVRISVTERGKNGS